MMVSVLLEPEGRSSLWRGELLLELRDGTYWQLGRVEAVARPRDVLEGLGMFLDRAGEQHRPAVAA